MQYRCARLVESSGKKVLRTENVRAGRNIDDGASDTPPDVASSSCEGTRSHCISTHATLVLWNESCGDLVLHPVSMSAHTYPLKSRLKCASELGYASETWELMFLIKEICTCGQLSTARQNLQSRLSSLIHWPTQTGNENLSSSGCIHHDTETCIKTQSREVTV